MIPKQHYKYMDTYLMFYHLYFDKPIDSVKVKGKKGGKQTRSKSDYSKQVATANK